MKAIAALGRLDTAAIVGVLLLLAASLAGGIAIKRADMRPLAFSMAVMVGTTLATFVLWTVVTPPKLGDPPLAGWRRVAGHVDHAAYILQRAAPAAAAWRCCIERSAHTVWIVGGVLLGVLVVSYPGIRGDSLVRFYFAANWIFLVLAYRAILPWAWRHVRSDDPARLPAVAAAALAAGDTTATTLGAHTRGFWGWRSRLTRARTVDRDRLREPRVD